MGRKKSVGRMKIEREEANKGNSTGNTKEAGEEDMGEQGD